MKIGIVSNLYRPYSRGGAEIVARRVAQELYRRGHEIFVISSMPYEGVTSLHESVTSNQVERVYRFYPLNLYHILRDCHTPFFLRAIWHLVDMFNPMTGNAVRRILEREKPDVVLTHNMKGLGLQGFRAIRASGIRQIHTLHDVQLSIPSGLLLAGQEDSWQNTSWLRTWYERQVQRITGSPEVVISPSKFLADFYTDRGFFKESQVRVMPNPAPDIPPRQRDHKEKKTLRLLFAGQLERHKGVMQLLDVVSSFKGRVELHIAGEGSLTNYVMRRSQRDRHIHYHGFVSFENLVKLFDIVDVTVVPSLCYENSPTVIYESFKAGVPVIASKIGGVGELVRDGENGLLIPSGDKKALQKAVETFLEDRHCLSMETQDLQKEIGKYSLVRYVDQIERCITGCADAEPIEKRKRSEKEVQIVLGVVQDKNGRVLIVKRRSKELGIGSAVLEWVFPGGKVKEGETTKKALAREILEESGCKVKVTDLISSRPHPEFPVEVQYYLCELDEKGGEVSDANIDGHAWVTPRELQYYFTTNLDPNVAELLKLAV